MNNPRKSIESNETHKSNKMNESTKQLKGAFHMNNPRKPIESKELQNNQTAQNSSNFCVLKLEDLKNLKCPMPLRPRMSSISERTNCKNE